MKLAAVMWAVVAAVWLAPTSGLETVPSLGTSPRDENFLVVSKYMHAQQRFYNRHHTNYYWNITRCGHRACIVNTYWSNWPTAGGRFDEFAQFRMVVRRGRVARTYLIRSNP